MKEEFYSLLDEIEVWKNGLGYASKQRVIYGTEMVLSLYEEVLSKIISDIQYGMAVFDDLFEHSGYTETVNIGGEDWDGLSDLDMALSWRNHRTGQVPEIFSAQLQSIDIKYNFGGLKADTAKWIRSKFHLNIYFGTHGYWLKFNEAIIWDSEYANRPNESQMDEIVLACVKTAFELIKAKTAKNA